MLTFIVFLAILIELLVLIAAIIVVLAVAIPVAWAFWNSKAEDEKRQREECQAALVDIVSQLEDYGNERTTAKCQKINEAIRAYNQKCPDNTVAELDC